MILDIAIPDITNHMIEVFLLLFLGLLAFIDIKKESLPKEKRLGYPAPLTSGALLLIALTNFQNLQFGILAFIFAMFLWDMEVFYGMSEFKMMTMVGFMIPNIGMFLLFVVVLLIFSAVYQALVSRLFKKKTGDDLAFAPIIFFTYLTILLVMVL